MLCALALAACGGAGSTADPRPTTSPKQTAAASAQPSPSDTAAKVKGSNVCTDAKGDSSTNDLRSVALKRDGDFLEVTWTMVKRDTGAGTAGFYLGLASADGNAAGQFGVKYLDGRQIAYFTFQDTNKEITDAAKVTRTSVTGQFPMSELESYGPNFTWFATTTRDGNDVDGCPNDNGDIMDPAVLRFAG
jgi:hypothetical protein